MARAIRVVLREDSKNEGEVSAGGRKGACQGQLGWRLGMYEKSGCMYEEWGDALDGRVFVAAWVASTVDMKPHQQAEPYRDV